MTCGGLCPGLNDVVQNIVYTLADYGVPLDQVPSCFLGSKAGMVVEAESTTCVGTAQRVRMNNMTCKYSWKVGVP